MWQTENLFITQLYMKEASPCGKNCKAMNQGTKI